jgi:hypothetical protein
LSTTTKTSTTTTPTPRIIDQYLTHYWPISDGQMTDKIGGADMTQGSLTTFTTDRFGMPNSALNLNGGWTQVPVGIYFNTVEFSISAWVYPQQVGSNARLFDFGNGQSNNILVQISDLLKKQPVFAILTGTSLSVYVVSSLNITENTWQFLTFTFNGYSAFIYINGQQAANLTFPILTMSTISRSYCYIGKSAWSVDGYSGSSIDDLRFYNVSLTQSEVIQLMNQNFTGDFMFIYFHSLLSKLGHVQKFFYYNISNTQ